MQNVAKLHLKDGSVAPTAIFSPKIRRARLPLLQSFPSSFHALILFFLFSLPHHVFDTRCCRRSLCLRNVHSRQTLQMPPCVADFRRSWQLRYVPGRVPGHPRASWKASPLPLRRRRYVVVVKDEVMALRQTRTRRDAKRDDGVVSYDDGDVADRRSLLSRSTKA